MSATDKFVLRVLFGILLASAVLVVIFPSYAGRWAAEAVKGYNAEMSK